MLNTDALTRSVPARRTTGESACAHSIVASSDKLGWPGLVAQRVFLRPSQCTKPARDDHVLSLQLSGSSRVERRLLCDGARATQALAEPGAIHLTPAGCGSEWRGSGEAEILAISLRGTFFSRVAHETFGRSPAGAKLTPQLSIRDPLIEQVGGHLLNELERPGPGGQLYVESLANTLAVHLLRHYAFDAKAEPDTGQALPARKLRRVVEYIDAHLEERLTLEQMAQLTGYSAFHFSRLFKQATRRSPHQYVLEQRVQRAKQLLKASRAPAAEIAYEVGFSSQSHLVTAFRKVVGVTPKVYRSA
ncbi:MAG: helix-turn-helix domain-containing protein [Gammaproteobacteria bacterium]